MNPNFPGPCNYNVGNSIVKQLSNLLLTEQYSDVVFKVGRGQHHKCFRAHKLILSSGSKKLNTILYGPLCEGGKPIEVPDLQPDGFYTMLKFVYEMSMDFDSISNAMNTLAAANKYEVNQLTQVCRAFVAIELSPQNAYIVFEKARLYGEVKLERSAIRNFILKTEEVIKDESFLQAERDTVEFILSQNSLSVSSESQLFDAVVRWGQANVTKPETVGTGYGADIRAVVNPLLPFVRFLSMSREEFTHGPEKSKILTEEEIESLLMNITCPGKVPLPIWVSNKPRRKSIKDSLITKTFCSLGKHTFSKETSVATDITFEGANILLCGITVLIQKCRTPIPFKFEIHNLTHKYSMYHYETRVSPDEDKCFIMLQNPELVCDGETWRIKIIFTDSEAVDVGLCLKDNTSDVINVVKFNSFSSTVLVHEIKYCIV